VKNYSAPSSPSTAPTFVKAANNSLVAMRSSQALSGVGSGATGMLRGLKPRFLEGLTPPEVKSILGVAEYRKLPAHSVITNQDQPAKHLFLLMSGRARYFFVTEKGQKVILLWIPPGEIIGLAAFLSPQVSYLTNTETARNSSVLVWRRDTIRRLAAEQPRLFENALSMTFRYLAAYRAAHRALICGTARERFAKVLTTLASGIGHKVEGGIELDVRNEELANEANVTLFTASRLLNEWQRAGVLRKSRGKIVLRSPERLLRYEK
jgi:CRP-like cAMP-binding protein